MWPRSRPGPGSARVPLGARLSNMLGIVNLDLPPHPRLLILLCTLALVAIVAVAIVAAWMLSHRPPPALDWFALVTTAIVVVMFLWPDQFHYHFAAFLAPFFAMSLGLTASRLIWALGQDTSGLSEGTARRLWTPAAVVAGLAIVVLGVFQASYESHLQLPLARVPAQVDKIIPKGACVATDQVSYLLMANRFTSNVPGCSHLLDGLGSDLAFSNGLKPSTGAGNVPKVQALWRDAFDHADYIWLSYNSYRRVAWFLQLRTYFAANFVPVFRHGATTRSTPAREHTPAPAADEAGSQRGW